MARFRGILVRTKLMSNLIFGVGFIAEIKSTFVQTQQLELAPRGEPQFF